MDSVFSVTAPIYLLIALGFAVVRLGAMDAPQVRALGRFAAQVCVPALLFRSIASQPLVRVLHADYFAVYIGASLATMGIVMLVARRLRAASPTLAALQGLGAAGSNSAFVGYPILQQMIGPAAGTALALNTLLENLLVIPLALVLADMGAGSRPLRERLGATLHGLARNPMILAIAIGLAVSALGWKPPLAVDRAVGLLAAAAAPVALFVIGGSLVGLKLAGIRADLALVAGSKLLLHPLLVLGLMLLVPIADHDLRVAGVMFAAMPMLSIYPVLAQRHGEERFCSAALLATTLASFATVSALMAALARDWPAAL